MQLKVFQLLYDHSSCHESVFSYPDSWYLLRPKFYLHPRLFPFREKVNCLVSFLRAIQNMISENEP